MKHAGSVFELVGMAVLCFGAYLLAPWLACAVGGIAIILIGQAMGGKPS